MFVGVKIRRSRWMVSLVAATAIAASSVLGGATADAAPRIVTGPGTEVGIIIKRISETQANISGCTIGFTATNRAGKRVAVTAGHCGRTGQEVVVNKYIVGRVAFSSNPPSRADGDGPSVPNFPDYSVIAFYPGITQYGGMGRVHPRRVGVARVGDPVCSQGAYSGWSCGKVLAVRGNYIYTSVARHAGDSGGPLIRTSDNAGLGILSTGRDTSEGPAVSRFFKLNVALQRAGLRLVTG